MEKEKEIVGKMVDIMAARENLQKAALEYARALEDSRSDNDDKPKLRRV